MASDTPFCSITYKNTLRWLTLATLKAVAPIVGQDKSSYPESIVLDGVLESNPSFPNTWVNPTIGKFAPLRRGEEGEKIPNFKGRRNAYFMAVKRWRPPQELAILGLDTKYKASFVLDRENSNRYVHTVISFGDDGFQAGILVNTKSDKINPSKATQIKAKPRQAKPIQAKPSQAKPSQAKPSQAKPSQAKQSQVKTDTSDSQSTLSKPKFFKPKMDTDDIINE